MNNKDNVLTDLQRTALVTCGSCSVLILPSIAFDPINVVKMAALVTGVFSMLPSIFSLRKQLMSGTARILSILIGLILISLSASLILSPSGWRVSIWGVPGRNTGFLTLISLVVLFSVGTLLAQNFGLKKLIVGFLYTSIPISFYGTLQSLEIDPIPWSQYAVFSTLGNINFSSAFFALVSILSVCFSWIQKTERAQRSNVGFWLAYALLNLVLSFATGSIQGPLMFLASALLGFVILTARKGNSKAILVVHVIWISSTSVPVLMGLVGSGPLGSLLKQETLNFRSDYWRAGLQMIADSPFFGKGPDSYGEWYRRSRDLLAVTRTSPDRTANTAHNIFIDFGVSAGLVACILLLLIFLVPMFLHFKHVIFSRDLNLYQFTILLFSFAYLLQSMISINQIGLSVWGWLFAGASWGLLTLPGFTSAAERGSSHGLNVKLRVDQDKKGVGSTSRRKEATIQRTSPEQFMLTLLGFIIGIFAVLPPLKSDLDFHSAAKSGKIEEMLSVSRSLGSNQSYMEETLVRMISLAPQIKVAFAREILAMYPSSLFAWRVIYDSFPEGSPERLDAADQMLLLDPLNPQFRNLG